MALTGTVWANTVWGDVWDAIWAAPGEAVVLVAPVGLASEITTTQGVTSTITDTVGAKT